MTQEKFSEISKEFSQYADRDYRGSSRLYESLSSFVSSDTELLEIASHGQSALPNLFFGAVHFLLMHHKNERLALYYVSLHGPKQIDDDLFPLFRSFCIQHRSELIEIISSRIVQTNEVSRCAYLYPAFTVVAKMCRNAPLGLIDIGASAGLHLLWDQYGYDYGLGRIYGDPTSPVTIKSALTENHQPEFDETFPRIQSRFAIDLRVVSTDKPDEIMWLDALIWPEHHSRRELFHRAIDLLKREKDKICFFEGDAADLLPGVLAQVSANEVPCVYQTHIWRQLSTTSKTKLISALEELGRDRAVFFVSALSQLRLELFAPSAHMQWTLANYEQHGGWVEWLFNAKAYSI
jgi:hypothetical protein